MNYLGHLVLSGKNEDVLFGNYIADDIKGNKYNLLPEAVQKGVLLHRFIDDFTDKHPAYLVGKRRMYEKLPKVSGIVMDILYDHLLWLNWEHHFSFSPDLFIDSCHDILDKKINEMPPRIKHIYHYMRKNSWLVNYQYVEGLNWAIKGIGKRIVPDINLEEFNLIFHQNKELYLNEFDIFFKDILIKSKNYLKD